MLKIPFYQNTKDNTHCVQAALKSVLKFHFPKKHYSFTYLDRVTAHKKGLWTWNSALLIFLARMGFQVINIENFNYKKFAQAGEKYLQKTWSKEVFETQKKFSDFQNEQRLARKLTFSKNIHMKQRPTTLRDLFVLFKKQYTILCGINPYVLDRQKGYAGHIVILITINKNSVTFHDPGLPPQKNRKVSLRLFFRAMGYPTKDSAALTAIKLKT